MASIDPRKTFNALKGALNEFQSTLHKPENTDKGKDHKGNQLASVFFKQYRKATWYFHWPEVLVMQEATKGKFIFTANSRPHGLLFTDLEQRLPQIECKEGYEAHWTHNVGSNIVDHGGLYFDDQEIQLMDYVSNDMDGQSMVSGGDRDARHLNLGNILELQQWSKALPTYPTSFTMPWSYSRDVSTYFPLYFCSFFNRLEHHLVLRRDINDLLRVRRVDDGQLVPADKASIKLVDGKVPGESMQMPLPTMWGDYLYLDDLECSHNRCAGAAVDVKDTNPGSQRNILYVDSILSCDESNPKSLGTTVPISIANTEFPVHTFGWVAQNETALANKYYSNYSTNAENHQQGYTPIATSTIETGKGLIFKKMPGHRTQRVYPGRQLRGTPMEPGYNFWTMGVKVDSTDPRPGVIIKQGTLSVELADTNPYIGLGAPKSTDQFKVRWRLTYTRRVVLVDFATNEAERNSGKRTLVEIQGAK